jgi:GntR family transcriptional regulator, transcriptional repressor for pyruvate dehydrogenase complex
MTGSIYAASMAFQIILPRRLYQEIAMQIKAHIESGEFSVGSRLPAERELAQQLKVSRPSVREALIALEVEGLVEVKTGAGVFVCERRRPFPPITSYEGPIEIMLARSLIEGDIAARAATKMRNADIKELERIVKAMNPSPTDQELCLPSDRAFHLYIAEKAGNSVLVRFVAELFDARHTPLSVQLGKHFEDARTWMLAVAEHHEIIKAFASRDSLAAKRAMERHLNNTCKRWTKQIDNNPQKLTKKRSRGRSLQML